MDNNFVENFKSEELEERLEFAKWNATADIGTVPIEGQDGIWIEGSYFEVGVIYKF